MKKIITFILACLLIVALSVNAYADDATRIGITSFYYSDLPGLDGGSRGRYANVTYSVLEQYLTDVRTAYPNYTYSMRVIGRGTCIGVYSSSNGLLGYLSTSSGFVYCNGDLDSGGSVISDGTSSHKITPIAGTGYYWIDTTYLGTLDRHYVDADTFSRIKLACSAAYRSNAIAIVQEGFQLDGTPSYVLKYLKNGEWVGVVCDEWGPVYCTTINGVGFHGDDGSGDSGNGAFFDDTEVINAINSVYRAISSVDDTLSYISTYTSRLNNNFVNFANELLTSLHMQSNDISNIYSVLLAMYQSFYDRFSDLDLSYYNDSEITIYNGENVDWSESDRGAIDIEANDIGTLELSGFPDVDGYRISHSIGGDIVVERNDGTYFPNEWDLSGGTVTMPTIESAYSSITVTAPVGSVITVAGNTHTFENNNPYSVNVSFGQYQIDVSYEDAGDTMTTSYTVDVDGYNDYAVNFGYTPGGFVVTVTSSLNTAAAENRYITIDGRKYTPYTFYGSGKTGEFQLGVGSVIKFSADSGCPFAVYVDGEIMSGTEYTVVSDCSIAYSMGIMFTRWDITTSNTGSIVGDFETPTVTVTVNTVTYTPVTISRLVRPSGSSVWLAYDTEGNVHEFTSASNLALNRSFVTHTYTVAEIAELDNFPTGYWQVSWTGESHYITVKFEEYSKFFLWLNRFLINFRDTLFMKMQDISVNAEGDVILHGSDHDYSVQLDRIIELLDGQGSYSCEHDYVADETQAATCVLPGLVVYNCSKCGDSYSEIVDPYGHDWICTDRVPDVVESMGLNGVVSDDDIPQSVISLCPDYGIGVNADCYNYIDWSEKKYHHKVGKVDLGTLIWGYATSFTVPHFYATVERPKTTISNLKCGIYTVVNGSSQSSFNPDNMSMAANSSYAAATYGRVLIRNDSYTDASAFKSAMSGVMLYYELATEEIIDLSAVIPTTVISSGYDVYTCSRCQEVYRDYDGSGAPDEAGGSIFKLVTKVFSRLGSLVGGILSSILNHLDNVLTRIDNLVSDFNARTQQVLSFGGDYPLWLSGVWGILPEELQIALGFCVVALILGIVGKKLVFS